MIPAPAATAQLTLTLSTQRGKRVTTYTVTNLYPDPKCAFPAWRLTKESGEAYDVALERFGPTCTCGQATYRGQGSKIQCKHVAAMITVGLLPRG